MGGLLRQGGVETVVLDSERKGIVGGPCTRGENPEPKGEKH